MIRGLSVVLILLCCLWGCATVQPVSSPPKSVSSIAPLIKATDGLNLPPFELHTLKNGLRLVLIENHAHPIIALSAYVTTGGRTENEHFAGALHFIEHLVFKGGTKRFSPTTFRKRIAELGDESGGWTWDDEIQFGFEVPKQNFGPALDVFAESLLELEWSKKWFEDERQVVLQEIKKVSERPWNKLWNAWDSMAFTNHPYRRPVIGTAHSINRQSMEELRSYYSERFTPNHLVLVVVGDFSTRRMLQKITRRFSKYERGPHSFELPNVSEPEPGRAKRRTIVDANAKMTRFIVGFRTPGASHPDTPGLMLLAELMNSAVHGLPAYLQRTRQWATSVNASYSFMVDHGHLTVEGEAEHDKASGVLDWLNQWLLSLEDMRFSRKALRNAAMGLLARRARGWKSYGAMAQDVGFWIERMGAEEASGFLSAIQKQTPRSIRSLAARYLKPNRYVEAVFTNTSSLPPNSERVTEPAAVNRLPSLKRPGLLEPLKQPRWTWQQTGNTGGVIRILFQNGLTLLVKPTKANALLSVVAHVGGGQHIEPEGKAGINTLTTRLLNRGTKHFNSVQWDRLLAAHTIDYETNLRFGSRSNVSRNVFSRDGSAILLTGTNHQWRHMMALLGEAIVRPVFSEGELSKLRRITMSEVETLPDDNLEFIKQEFYRLAFPEHPYGRPTIGDVDTLSSITQGDVAAFHARHYAPDRITLSVVGHVDPLRVAEFIASRWSDWKTSRAGPVSYVNKVTPRIVSHRRKILKRGRKQWCINYGFPTVSSLDKSFETMQVLFGIVRGHHFYKYVYERGVSYRSWIKFWPHLGSGLWLVENDIAQSEFTRTTAEIERDLRRYSRGRFSSDEVELSRNRLLNRHILDSQKGALTAFRLARSEGIGFGYQRFMNRSETLGAVTLEQVNKAARRVFGNRSIYRMQLR